MPQPFPRDEAADYQGLIDFNRSLDADRPGLLSHIFSAGKDMISQGGLLNPGRLVEPSVEGVLEAGDFVAEMVSPIPPLDDSIRSALDGRYVDAFAEGASAIPMVATFAGRAAKTANLPALARAEQLAEAGADRRAIWDETGWFKGPDGQWRFEIDDSGAKFPGMNGEVALKKRARMDQSFKHDELFEAYPDAAAIPLKPEYANPRYSGMHYPGADEKITLNPNILGPGKNKPKATSTALHELQHAVQSREGFATGGNIEEFANPRGIPSIYLPSDLSDARILDTMMKGGRDELEAIEHFKMRFNREPSNRAFSALERIGDGPELESARRALERAENPYETYRSLAGEVEARNVQTRMDMTPAERRARPPWETQDVPDDMQIVRGRSDGPQMSVDLPMDEASRMARDLPPPRNAAEQQADEIADMLRTGRGSEVTDEMMEAADPQRLSRLYEGGATGREMPMDADHRQYRASQMGFKDSGIASRPGDGTKYHQTTQDIPAFELNAIPDSHSGGGAIWLNETPHNIPAAHNTRLDGDYLPGTNTMPVVVRSGRRVGMDAKYDMGINLNFPQVVSMDENAALRAAGYGHGSIGTEMAVLNPADIRSRFARFDPRLSHLRNLNAGLIPIGLGTVGAMPLLAESTSERP
jgi:hypothetical protein